MCTIITNQNSAIKEFIQICPQKTHVEAYYLLFERDKKDFLSEAHTVNLQKAIEVKPGGQREQRNTNRTA